MAQIIKDYFVCIGAQKAGTTWLARMLDQHPDIFQTPVKEIHYFDHVAGLSDKLSHHKRRARRRKYYLRMATQWRQFAKLRTQRQWYRHYLQDPIDDAWYHRLFAERNGARFAGEITPEYAITGITGLAHIKRLAPDARVIYIMRNPVAQAWSQVLHECRKTGRDARALSIEEAVAIARSPHYRRFADYVATLDDLAKVFTPAQTLILFYEDIHQDRLAALETICRFIGTAFDPHWFAKLSTRFNAAQKVVMPAAFRARLREENQAQIQAIAQRLGRLPVAWQEELAL